MMKPYNNFQYKIYRTATVAFSPFVKIYLNWRKSKGKEDPERLPERLGFASIRKPDGKLLWVHAASVGESISVLPLINKIIEEYKDINIMMTSGTVTSAKLLAARLPTKVIHQYVPVDIPSVINKFLNHWKPDIALWVESELWPNLVIETYKTSCKLIQINARISEDSYKKWQKYNQLGKAMLSCFSLSLAQSEVDAERLRKIGAKNVIISGNLKFDSPPLPADPYKLGEIIKKLEGRTIWVAASIHPGEDEIIISAHGTLLKKHPNLLTIIIPRHPSRGENIASLIPDNIKYSLRSKNDEITPETSVYIADTMGELGIFYRVSGIIFMGGSLVNHGGQNPLEPARLECAIITGPHIHNFTAIYDELASFGAVIEVRDGAELTEQADKLLTNHNLRETIANSALSVMNSKKGIINRYMTELAPYLKPLITTIE